MMFLPILDLVVLGIGCVFLGIWLIFFLQSKKYDSIFQTLDEKEYPLKELYSTGYAVLELVHYNYKSKYDRKFRQELEVLYEKKYVEFYLRVAYARALTYGMLLFLSGFILYGISGELMLLPLALVYSGVAIYYFLTESGQKIKKRSEELLKDFSEVVSKLALLTNAGMILREAWKSVADAGTGTFYGEMRLSMDEMNNGISEVEAYRRFGIRCMVPEVKKFSATLIQGVEKGNKELTTMLQEQSAEVWSARKQNVRREGEKAASKLMLPIFMMFIGILIMVIVPIFANLGGV